MPPTAEPTSHGLLTGLQQDVLTAIFATSDDARAFGLFGGTALAEFYAGHRLSEDLDLFTFEPALVRPLGAVLPAALTDLLPGAEIQRTRAHELFQELQVARGDDVVRIQLGPADPPQLAAFHRVGHGQVASIDDLAAMKCHALCDRGEPRDAVDVWALVHIVGFRLDELQTLLFSRDPGLEAQPLAWAEALLRQGRHPGSLIESLAPLMRVALTDRELKQFLIASGEEVLRSLAADATSP